MTTDAQSQPARYIMIGGFLGAGKTTAVAALAKHLHDEGLRVGLITNDQGNQLVDTAMLASRGFPTQEIAGGCFCCRFNSLMEAARRLSETTRPDVFIAEPVGSCTDLVATVSYPLRRIYGDHFSIAPLTVLVDPVRARRVFELEPGGNFSEKVTYIYRKQLEEADVIAINKCDLMDEPQLAALRRTLGESFPRATIFEISARHGTGLQDWFRHITAGEQSKRDAMEVDYDTYAEGEALLGWLNATVQVRCGSAFDGNAFLRSLAKNLQALLAGNAAEIAHLKMTLEPDSSVGDLAVVNLVRNDFVPELSQQLADELASGSLIINIRAEAAPERIESSLRQVLRKATELVNGLALQLQHIESFRPGRPTPTHRDL